ncbi:hypothetical protein MRX96_010253 [Rhipicephalus microplus]
MPLRRTQAPGSTMNSSSQAWKHRSPGADAVNPLESTAPAGDTQDTDADSRTIDIQHDDDESPATTKSEEGWHTVHYGRRRKPGHGSVRDADDCVGDNKAKLGFEPMGQTTRTSNAKLIFTKKTSTRALDIETRKATTNKIPLRFKAPQPCKLPPQFQVGIGV